MVTSKGVPTHTMMDARFLADYTDTSNAILAQRYAVSRSTIARWARAARLQKSAAYRSSIQRHRATGRPVTEAMRSQLRAAATGRSLSAATKAKIALTKQHNRSVPRGQDHYKWKGGKPWERFADPRYIAWRAAVLERDVYTCRKCGRSCAKYERGLAAHHVKPFAEFPESRLDVTNGLTLCRVCHMAVHGKTVKPALTAPCACGCGAPVKTIDLYGRPRRFINGHGRRKPFG
jgi:hypothetical protein